MIRLYENKDYDTLVKLIIAFQDGERLWEKTYAPGSEMASQWLNALLECAAHNEGRILVAELDNKVVGYIAFWKEVSETQFSFTIPFSVKLSDIYVLPECRGKGIAKELMKEVDNYAREIGSTQILLNVLYKNEVARTVYEKNGYRNYDLVMVKEI
jgi:GNAT superfamily N-acetyltransferase